jgi:hypothetical protein
MTQLRRVAFELGGEPNKLQETTRDGNTLFEIGGELDSLLDEIEEQTKENGSASPEFMERFQQFREAESAKVDVSCRVEWARSGYRSPSYQQTPRTLFGALAPCSVIGKVWRLPAG